MKNIRAIRISTIITIIVTVIITIWSELSKSFKDFLAGFSGHHWVTKGWVAIALFLALSFIFSKNIKEEGNVWQGTKAVIWVTSVSIIVIFAFYVWHFFA